MVVVNLYPFKETISKPDVTVEQARGNIDIGGPCMIRASAKNYIRVASVVDPADYEAIHIRDESESGIHIAGLRFRLAQKAFEYTAVLRPHHRRLFRFQSLRMYRNVMKY